MDMAAKGAKRGSSGKRVRPPIHTESLQTINGRCVTRRQRRGVIREYVPLEDFAELLGLDSRTLKKHIEGEDFVRVIGDRWLVQEVPCRTWLDRQRPKRGRKRGGR